MAAILKGKRVRLDTVALDKIELVNQWFNDPYITKNLNVGVAPFPLESSKSFAERSQRPSEKVRNFSINALDLPKEEEYIGHIGLHDINWLNRTAELGIVIGKREHLNKGYGTDAIKTLLRFAFLEMNLNRVMLTHFEFNELGHHAYLKAGFKEEGRLRKHIFRNGRYWNMIVMGILREEFLELI
ncbi:hypothetical protein BHF71_03325 [Vulcanibacillus modesticaldus]|uniref:N-acetyltransferase domain-containing protein n=1 Tax=Vulcanibacillus modesticaldus TaxID=337097 RepID=A0A1D2YSR9_9BACI|nr:GNAT family protein [Vulcanibacillus modesticaldus]OEF98064.1 hypothetical protein BHF71_03325 [Vulcanibacillus modesticaldus]